MFVHSVTTLVTGFVPYVTEDGVPQKDFDAYGIVNLVLLFGLPLLVALVTAAHTSSQIKAVLLLGLSGVSSVLNQWLLAPGGFDWSQTIYAALVIFLGGSLAHLSIYRHTVAPALQNTLVKD